VRVIVLARLLGVKARAAEAAKGLREMAARKDVSADEARAALAAVGDRSVVPLLVAQSQKGEPWQRGRSAVALYRLGETVPAARALADADPGVRIAVSCGILAAR
jgi:HEAT repeat protein